MALKLDNSLLEELGLGSLPETEKLRLRQHIYETLEMRVGMRLADQMTNEQLDEFEQYVNAQDDAGAFKWLETNFPNYKDVVNDEFEKLKAEVGQVAPQILASGGMGAPAVPAPDPAIAPIEPPAQPYAPPAAPAPTPEYQPPVAPQPAQSPQPTLNPYPPAPDYPPQQPPAGPGTPPQNPYGDQGGYGQPQPPQAA